MFYSVATGVPNLSIRCQTVLSRAADVLHQYSPHSLARVSRFTWVSSLHRWQRVWIKNNLYPDKTWNATSQFISWITTRQSAAFFTDRNYRLRRVFYIRSTCSSWTPLISIVLCEATAGAPHSGALSASTRANMCTLLLPFCKSDSSLLRR